MTEDWWLDADWADCMRNAGLHDFAAAWRSCNDPVDDINHRDKGWSAVHRVQVVNPSGEPALVYLKQQWNYLARGPRHPVRGEPVVARERRNLNRFVAADLPVPRAVCYGTGIVDGMPAALLGTAGLTGYLALDEWEAAFGSQAELRQQVIREVGRLISRMHDQALEFRCLYPKHVYVRVDEADAIHLSFIDLENARKFDPTRRGKVRDLGIFFHRWKHWQETDRDVFLAGYLGSEHTKAAATQLWDAISERIKQR